MFATIINARSRASQERSGLSQTTARSNSHVVLRIAPLVFCLMAFALGIYGLGARSLWGDEAFSLWASRQPAIALLGGLDAQPPLYHLTLAVGRLLWGESVFAIRFASLCCGVALVAIAGRLGRMIGGSRGAGLCAFAVAVSPMALYFDQEARMYALGAALAAGTMLLAVALLRRIAAPRRWWITYVLFSLGALYTHYYTVGILAANTLALLGHAVVIARRTRNARPLVMWLMAHVAIALAFGVWFFGLQFGYFGRAATQRSNWIPPLNDIVTNLGRGINGLVFGMRAEAALTPLAVLLFALAVLGLLGYWRRRRTRSIVWITLLWLVIGIAVVALTAATSGIVPDFSPRYLIFILLPLVVAACGWVVGDWRSHLNSQSPIPAIPDLQSLILIAAIALPALYGNAALFDPSWAKSRYDQLAHVIRERSAPGDGVVLLNSDQFPLYDYYGPKAASVWLMSNDLWDASRADELDRQFDTFIQDKRRVWLVNYGFAAALSSRPRPEQRLNALGARVYHQGFQDATLSLYQLLGSAEDAPFEDLSVRFGEHIRLTGARWRARQFAPGEAVTLDLRWQAGQKLATDYTVFVHLRRAQDGVQVVAFDSPPMNGAAPTTTWTPGESITDTHAIVIPADARPGEYMVVIGMYEYPSFERLAILGQDAAGATEYVLGSVNVGD